MRRMIGSLCAALLVLLCVPAAAEEASPIAALFHAEKKLLFETPIVIMSGKASFSMEGVTLREASLTAVQDGSESVRDWRLSGFDADGNPLQNGYTIVVKENPRVTGYSVYVYGSAALGRREYYSLQPRNSLIRRTVGMNALLQLTEALLTMERDFAPGSITAAPDGTTITLSLAEADIPQSVQELLNLLTQYGLHRYTNLHLDEASAEIPYALCFRD